MDCTESTAVLINFVCARNLDQPLEYPNTMAAEQSEGKLKLTSVAGVMNTIGLYLPTDS